MAGHVPGHAVSSMGLSGRGFAAQQLLEELQSRAELSEKVRKKISRGEHRRVTLITTLAWAERVLYGERS